MLPLKNDNPTRCIPIFTIGLIAVNCLIHFYQMTLPYKMAQLFVYQFGLIPIEVIHFRDMTPDIPFPVLLSPFSSMFIHGDLVHLGGNMLYLWIFGKNIEDYLGHSKFLIFYLMSGLAAVALFVLFNPHGTAPLVGASGAIAGILGAYMVVFPRARVLTLIWIIFIIRLIWLPAVFILGYWFVIQLLMALSSIGLPEGGGVAWFAHIGGFVFGWLYIRRQRKRKQMVSDSQEGDSDYYNRWH